MAGHRTSPCWHMHSVNLEAWHRERKLQSHNTTGVRYGLNVGWLLLLFDSSLLLVLEFIAKAVSPQICQGSDRSRDIFTVLSRSGTAVSPVHRSSFSIMLRCYIHMFDALVRRAAPAVMQEFTAKELQSLLARSTQYFRGSKRQPDPLLI